jgi:glycosyltransferase involved in cell wall biosynthesis
LTSGRPERSLLIVAPSAYTLSGLAVWIDYLVPGLRQRGWSVTLGLVSGPRHHDAQNYMQAYPIPNSIAIHCGCSTNSGRITAVRKAIRKVEPDVVLTVNIPHAIRAAGLERQEGRPLKVVMSCHGIQEDLFADMRLLHAELDAVVCTNRLACRLSETLGQVEEQQVFHCACGTAVPQQMPALPQNDLFTIGFSGRMEQPQKRIFDLIDIAQKLKARCPRFQVLVAGSGPEQERFLADVSKQGLEPHFNMLGFVPANQMQDQFYSKIDALLVTSSWETGPIVIWEAMAAGVPVVTSRYIGSGAEGILKDQQNCVMFDIADCEQAAQNLMDLQDLENSDILRHNAFKTAAELLSHEASVSNWDRILKHILLTNSPKIPVAPEVMASSGRLDKLLGPRLASYVRAAIGRQPPDGGPGGEWPHTMAGNTMTDSDFFELATRLDRSSDFSTR